MACPRCQKVTSEKDHITCRGYCGESFHAFCVNVDQPAVETLKQHVNNVFWMCDGCAALFASGHFRNLAMRYDDGQQKASNESEAINSLKDGLARLNDAVNSLSAKVDCQPKTPVDSLKFRYNDVLKTTYSPKRRRVSENH